MLPKVFDRVPRLLRETAFRRYWIGHGLSQLGDQVSGLALPLTAVLVLHANAEDMGLLTAIGMIPSLLFSIPAGAWVDRRGHRRRVMMAADIARAVLLASIPLGYFLGWLTLPALLVTEFLVGTCSVLYRVSSNTLFVSLVPQEQFVEANSLLQGNRARAFLAGPGIAGVLIDLLSAPVAILADALSFVASALSLASIRPEEPPAAQRDRQVTAGLRFVWRSGVLRSSQAAMATINLFRGLSFALYVLYATRYLNLSAGDLGIILGPGSILAVLGSAMVGRITRWLGLGRTFLLGTALYTVPLILIPMAGGPHLVALAVLLLAESISAAGLMILEISYGSIQAAAVPDSIRARVGGATGLIGLGTRALGALLGGLLPGMMGLRPTMWLATIGAALGCLWLLPSPVVRLRTVGDFAPQER